MTSKRYYVYDPIDDSMPFASKDGPWKVCIEEVIPFDSKEETQMECDRYNTCSRNYPQSIKVLVLTENKMVAYLL